MDSDQPPEHASTAGDGAVAQREVLLWDDGIHEHKEASLLYFWRLEFGAEYDREAILERLRRFYREFGITSYCVYQTLGDYDLLLRLWVPRRFIAEEISTGLRTFLGGTTLGPVDYLACHTRTHWAKSQAGVSGRAGAAELESVGEDVVSAVNAFNRAQFNEQTALPRPTGSEGLIAARVLAPISLETRGIRMFVLFDRARRAGDNYHEDVLDRLTRGCESIEREWSETHAQDSPPPWPTGPQFSIYSGQGPLSDFLIMARAPHGDFHDFTQLLITRLRELGLAKTYHIRPYTFVIADRLFTDFQEQRASSADITPETLRGQEHETLEFKATFAVNLRRWRSDGTRTPDEQVKDQVVKSVCGFLNSLEGGSLIIGVLEAEREYVKANAAGSGAEFLAWLTESFHYRPDVDDSGALIRPLPNALIGVKNEYDGPKTAYRDADKYYGAIRDVLRERIEPNPLGWLRVGEREIEGQSFAIVTVRPADTWCYAKLSNSREPQFFVREAASTRSAAGREAELYREADPRDVSRHERGRPRV
jgi:hypothetical protein